MRERESVWGRSKAVQGGTAAAADGCVHGHATSSTCDPCRVRHCRAAVTPSAAYVQLYCHSVMSLCASMYV